MGGEGYIKLYRKMWDNPVVTKDADHLAVWIYLLTNATHAEHPALFKGEKIMLKPGQLITGRIAISKRLRVQESKVKRILTCFETDQQIERQRGNQNSLISIVNWNQYQQCDHQNDQPVTSHRPASDQPMTTNKNVKNVRMKEVIEKDNNNKKDNKYNIFRAPAREEVKAYCIERGNDIDVDAFMDFYESKGWMVGRNKMKDWRAAVRNWERNRASKSVQQTQEGRLDWIDRIEL